MRRRINLSNSSMRDKSDWHNKFLVDMVDQFLIDHDVKQDGNVQHALILPNNIKLLSTWLNSKGFDVQPWWLETSGSIVGYGFDFETDNEYYIEAKLKYV